MHDKTLSIRNHIEEMRQLPLFLKEACIEFAIPQALIATLTLAVEEAMVNCINYAYEAGEEGEITLTVHRAENKGAVYFILQDKGKAFDPTGIERPDTELPLEARPIGGLGILLLQEIMDTVTYRRQDGINTLTMCKVI